MPQLMQFRVARAPQRRRPDASTLVSLDEGVQFDFSKTKLGAGVKAAATPAALAAPATAPDPIGSRLALDTFLTGFSPASSPLFIVDELLVSTNNAPVVADLDTAITTNIVPVLSYWWPLRSKLGELLATSLQSTARPDVLDRLVRLLLVMSLVEKYIKDPTPFQTPQDIFDLLRWSIVLMPDDLADTLRKRVNARRMGEGWDKQVAPGGMFAVRSGFADLYTTEEEWLTYEAGEIAFIENILPGELKERRHFDLNQVSSSVVTDTTKSTSQQNETQSTDRSDLRSQSTSDVTLAAHIDGQVDTSGQYGPTKVNTHLGGSLDFSTDHSVSHAVTQSHETVSRAVTSVTEVVRTIRTTATLNKSTDLERHALDNKGQPNTIVGIYRWVNKRSAVRVMRYPHRFLLEFVLPEPGAWMRWLHRNDEAAGVTSSDPIPFTDTGKPDGTPLKATDLLYLDADKGQPTYYLTVAARYSAAGLTPPPSDQIVGLTHEKDSRDDHGSPGKQPIHYATANLAVPNGYGADSWEAFVVSWTDPGNAGSYITISVGGSHGTVTPDDPNAPGNDSSYRKRLVAGPGDGIQDDIGPITQGSIPVSILGNGVDGWSINIVVTCIPTPDSLKQWQISTYDIISGAYTAMKRQYDQDMANAQLAGANRTFGDASNPTWNQTAVTEDLKRQVVEFLVGSPFNGRNAIEAGPTLPDPVTNIKLDTGPEIDVPTAASHAAEIEFLEQAFEWENLTYVLYPYFWTDRSRWPSMATISGVDTDFARFLRAGAARVVIPARPMFAAQVSLYASLGVIWGGGQPPAPNDPDYLSVADEIRAQERKPLDGTQVDAWKISVPTTLVWLQNTGEPPVLDGALPENSDPDFPPPA